MSAGDQLEPVFGPDGQPDVATLAGLELDAFDAETTARLRARLRDTPQARETLAALHTVQARLHDQPTPKVPDSVADRISAALRAEQADRSSSRRTNTGPSVVITAPPPANVSSLDAARERRARRARWMGGAAAGVAVVAVGGIIYGVTTRDTTSGNPDSNPQAFGDHPTSTHGTVKPNGATAPGPGIDSPPDYSASSLANMLPAIVRTAKLGVNLPDGYGNGPDITDCAQTLGQSGQPIAVQHATFDKQDSYIFVFPTGTDHQAKVYVVTPTCIGDPLYQTSGTY